MSQTVEQASRGAGIYAYTFSDSFADAVMLPADFAAEVQNSGISITPVSVAIDPDGVMAFDQAKLASAAPAQSTDNMAAGAIAENAGGDGTDAGTIMPHAITNGMTDFDSTHLFTSADIFTSALIDTSTRDHAASHAEANIAHGEIAAFNIDRPENGSFADAVDVLEVFHDVSTPPEGDSLIAIYDTAAAVTTLSNIAAVDTMKIV